METKTKMLKQEHPQPPFEPTRPQFTGKLQIANKNVTTGITSYVEEGEIALWTHANSKYLFRGYVTIDDTRYLVSLTENDA
jgi:hypothetical protein